MKKIILILVLMAIGVSSCHETPGDKRIKDITRVLNTMYYYKDSQTGLCFAAITSRNAYGDVTSITCVPCDSLKKIGIK